MENDARPRKVIGLIVLYVGTVIAITIGIFLFHYLCTGTISVTTSGESDVITITNIKDLQSGKPATKQSIGHLSARLPAGTYQISAQGQTLGISKVIILPARKSLSFSFTPPKALSIEPVIGLGAIDVSADSSQLYYINSATGGLYTITSQNQLNAVSQGASLGGVQWISPGYGVGKGSDGLLYLIQNDSVSALNLPISNSQLHYAVTSDGHIYVSSGGTIYYGTPQSGVKRIYQGNAVPTQLVASSKNLLVVYRGGGKPTLVTIDTTGEQLGSASLGVDNAAWSPDGANVAITNGSTGEILDSTLQHSTPLPGSHINSLTWLDNDSILYGIKNVLWSYNLNADEATVLTSFNAGTSIAQLTVDQQKQYVYSTIQAPAGVSLQRVGLARQAVADETAQLSVFFPASTDNCYINYVNFTRPALSVQVSGGLVYCQQQVQAELSNDGLDASKLQINYVTSTGAGS